MSRDRDITRRALVRLTLAALVVATVLACLAAWPGATEFGLGFAAVMAACWVVACGALRLGDRARARITNR